MQFQARPPVPVSRRSASTAICGTNEQDALPCLWPRAHTEPRYLIEVLHDVEVVDDSLPSRSCGWQDVVNAIESATAQDKAKADKSIVRARLRKSAPELAVLESLANMIPDQDGLSILRGGLTTLCKASAFVVSHD